MSSDQNPNNPNLPPWLRGVPLPPRPPEPGAPAGPPPEAAALPEWLRDLGDDQPAAQAAPPTEPLPDWLSNLSEPSALPGTAEPLPDWLRDMGGPGDSAPEHQADVPDWLRETQRTIAPEPTPDIPSTEAPSAPAEPLPSWLLDTSEPTAPTPSQPAPDALPSWLAGDQPSEPSAPVQPAPDALPSWLAAADDQPSESSGITPFSFDEGGSTPPAAERSWLANDLGASGETIPDWLASSQAGEPVQPAEPEQLSQPLWMQDRGALSPEPAQPAAEPTPADDLPDWLRDASAEQPPAAPQAPPAPQAPADDLPDWLRDSGAAHPAAPEQLPSWLGDTTSSPPAPATEEIPSWLSDTSRPAAPATEEIPSWLGDTTSSPPAPATEEIPSWLSDTTSSPPAPAQPEELPAPPAAEDLPAWLRDMPAGPPSAATAPPAAEDLPAWLRPTEASAAASQPADANARPSDVAPRPASKPADDLPPWLSDEHGQPLPTAGAPGDSNLPSWLRGANAGPPAPPLEPAPTQPAPAAEPARTKPPTTELVGGIELPVWLRPTETEAPKEISPTDARALDWLTRLGPADDEAESVPAPALKLTPPAAPTRSSAQLSAIALLEQLAAAPFPELAAEPAPAPRAAWQRLRPELLLYLALIAALIAALLTPAPALLGLNTPPSMPSADALFSQIDGLTADDTVLVGYEWDARRSSELRPLERAVLDHLIQHQVKLVLVSTDPQGSLLLYDMRDRLEQAGYQPRGEDYILLGYKPGAELALRTIAQSFPSTLRSDFQGNDASDSILATDANRQLRLRSIADFSMVLVLADDASDVQGWMEQVHPSASRADGSYVPFGFLMPAETTPIVQPYLSQANVTHLDGRQGALAYQQLRGDNGMPAAQVAAEAGQQRMGTLAYLALLLIGAIAVGVYSAATRGRNRA